MKIRTDFVTNSSSSNFTLVIDIYLKNGESVGYFGNYTSDGDDELICKVSPKQLGTAKTVNELIELLKNGVVGGVFDEKPLFGDDGDKYDLKFIEEIRNNITDMKQIKSISVRGDEFNYFCYLRRYSYNLETGEYTGYEKGFEFEKDGSSGGDLIFSDLDSCDIEYEEGDGENGEYEGWD